MIEVKERDTARSRTDSVCGAAPDTQPAAAPPLGEITEDIWGYFFAAALRGYPHETKERKFRNR